MVLLVTGAAGMLGSDVCQLATQAGLSVHAADVRECPIVLDITDPRQVETVLDIHPDAVIHCAAYTDVEGAERNAADAYRVNALGTWLLAEACRKVDAALCYISTDFVFDGRKSSPYHEFDAPAPLNVYAASKLAGEHAVVRHCPRHWIVRTAWLYGLNGKSFVRTILNRAKTGGTLRVVADQIGCPTYTSDLASLLLWIVKNAPYGTYHCVNSGCASWYQLAVAAVEAAGMSRDRVHPVRSCDWPSAVQRPRYSVLTSLTGPAVGMPTLRPWRDALKEFVAQTVAESHGDKSP